jgi:hypothetical protein
MVLRLGLALSSFKLVWKIHGGGGSFSIVASSRERLLENVAPTHMTSPRHKPRRGARCCTQIPCSRVPFAAARRHR